MLHVKQLSNAPGSVNHGGSFSTPLCSRSANSNGLGLPPRAAACTDEYKEFYYRIMFTPWLIWDCHRPRLHTLALPLAVSSGRPAQV